MLRPQFYTISYRLPAVKPISLSAALRRTLRHAAYGLLDLLYPPCCVGCGARLNTPDQPLCMRCTASLERAGAGAVSARLARLPEAQDAFAGAYALWHFDKAGRLQRVLHALKYGNRPHYGLTLGRLLGRAYQSAAKERPDLLLPIPLHRARFLERGYNQSVLLARGAAEAMDYPVRTDLLRRARPTHSQTTLSRSDRWANVENAFVAPNPSLLAGRCVLLIDDVLTTGATAAAAAHTLHDAGANRVHLATLALARR